MTSGQSAPQPLSGPVIPGHSGGAAAGVLVAQEESCLLITWQGQPRGPSGVFTLVGPHSSSLLAGLVALRSWSCQPTAGGSLSGKLCSELSFRADHLGHHSGWQSVAEHRASPRPAPTSWVASKPLQMRRHPRDLCAVWAWLLGALGQNVCGGCPVVGGTQGTPCLPTPPS